MSADEKLSSPQPASEPESTEKSSDAKKVEVPALPAPAEKSSAPGTASTAPAPEEKARPAGTGWSHLGGGAWSAGVDKDPSKDVVVKNNKGPIWCVWHVNVVVVITVHPAVQDD